MGLVLISAMKSHSEDKYQMIKIILWALLVIVIGCYIDAFYWWKGM